MDRIEREKENDGDYISYAPFSIFIFPFKHQGKEPRQGHYGKTQIFFVESNFAIIAVLRVSSAINLPMGML